MLRETECNLVETEGVVCDVWKIVGALLPFVQHTQIVQVYALSVWVHPVVAAHGSLERHDEFVPYAWILRELDRDARNFLRNVREDIVPTLPAGGQQRLQKEPVVEVQPPVLGDACRYAQTSRQDLLHEVCAILDSLSVEWKSEDVLVETGGDVLHGTPLLSVTSVEVWNLLHRLRKHT